MPHSNASLEPALDAPVASLQTQAAGTLRYYHDDSGPGRPLLLLHSINAAPSAMEIRPLFERFSGQRPVIAPDLPGFGLSDRGDRRYTPQLYAGAIIELLRAVTDRPADIVALSLTSEFAARAVLQAPDICHSLAVISPTGLGERVPPGPTAQRRLRRFFGLPLVGSGLYRALTTRASIRYFLGKAFHDAIPPALVDYACATTRQPGASHAPFAFLSMGLFSADARTTLYEPLPVPGLVIYDTDPNVSFETLPALLERAPQWQSARVAPTRGLPHWEQPAATFDALETFWRGIETAGNRELGGTRHT